jgi:threonine aldolase
MEKYSFKDDYSEGAHPDILELLTKSNHEQLDGYADDFYSKKAKQLIIERIGNPEVAVHLVVGGTLANLIIIAAMLRPHESVIAANTGHISLHEAGAIEATGHKINSIKTIDGKIKPEDIRSVLDEHQLIPHMVKPKLVYISNTTEVGTIYTKDELIKLSRFCKENKLYLYLDGARLGVALTSHSNDLTLNDLAKLTDVFYIGGTKNGALIGEAIVINNTALQADFAIHLKQKGALTSKGRLLGIQFFILFKDKLFFDLAKQANKGADKLRKAIKQEGFSFLSDSTTNQLFPIFPNNLIDDLQKKFKFHIWEKYDDNNSVVRLVTSWATPIESVNKIIRSIKKWNK